MHQARTPVLQPQVAEETYVRGCRAHGPARGSVPAVSGRGTLAVIGTLDVSGHDASRPFWGGEKVAYISTLCVAEATKRQGVGSALVQGARKLARRWGARRLQLHVFGSDTVARSFYARSGFVEVTEGELSTFANERTLLLEDTLLTGND
ncbi:hypothetical protein WJX72_005357 [[Myrmecia] bisecta]|uniref:N-acetyltransferase domain-containing protein n=1 Tax=[Myrmecia] bisecta TaxID=41462 RepID=A0AAW1PYE8_9CHLO